MNNRLILTFCLLTAASGDDPASNDSSVVDFEDPGIDPGGIFEGDILLVDEENRGALNSAAKWTNGRVSYKISPEIGGRDRQEILLAMKDIEEAATCIKFEPWADSDWDYINIIKDGQKCYSSLGRQGGEQYLSLGEGCYKRGVIIHELLHALGFMHEYNRSDRDDYLFIYEENIIPSALLNFKKLSPEENVLYTPFDLTSVMMDGPTMGAFPGKISMEAKNGRELLGPGTRGRMSQSDMTRVNCHYQCNPLHICDYA